MRLTGLQLGPGLLVDSFVHELDASLMEKQTDHLAAAGDVKINQFVARHHCSSIEITVGGGNTKRAQQYA